MWESIRNLARRSMPNEQPREASRAGSVPGRTRSLFGKLLATALLVYLVYLWPIPAPLVIRQLYFARSISEGSLSIDPYVPPVGDAAAIGSHFYATTPPLEAALGAPIIAVSKASGLVAS